MWLLLQGLTEEMQAGHAVKNIPERTGNQSKAPRLGASVACLQDDQEASVAGGEQGAGEVRGGRARWPLLLAAALLGSRPARGTRQTGI